MAVEFLTIGPFLESLFYPKNPKQSSAPYPGIFQSQQLSLQEMHTEASKLLQKVKNVSEEKQNKLTRKVESLKQELLSKANNLHGDPLQLLIETKELLKQTTKRLNQKANDSLQDGYSVISKRSLEFSTIFENIRSIKDLEEKREKARDLFQAINGYKLELRKNGSDLSTRLETIQRRIVRDILPESYIEGEEQQADIDFGGYSCGCSAISLMLFAFLNRLSNLSNALLLGNQLHQETLQRIYEDGVRTEVTSRRNEQEKSKGTIYSDLLECQRTPSMTLPLDQDSNSENLWDTIFQFLPNAESPVDEFTKGHLFSFAGDLDIYISSYKTPGEDEEIIYNLFIERNGSPEDLQKYHYITKDELKNHLRPHLENVMNRSSASSTFDISRIDQAPGFYHIYTSQSCIPNNLISPTFENLLDIQAEAGLLGFFNPDQAELDTETIYLAEGNPYEVLLRFLQELDAISNKEHTPPVGAILNCNGGYHSILIKRDEMNTKHYYVLDSHGKISVAKRGKAFCADFTSIEDAARFLQVLLKEANKGKTNTEMNELGDNGFALNRRRQIEVNPVIFRNPAEIEGFVQNGLTRRDAFEQHLRTTGGLRPGF